MGAEAERHMVIGAPSDVELVRSIEDPLVTIPRRVEQQEFLPLA